MEQEKLTEVLKRAQEISDQSSLIFEPHPEIEQYVRAAEEIGISRDATLQALRERLDLPLRAFEAGEMVFARSKDDRYYAAKVLEVDGRRIRLQFLSGSDHECDVTDLRLFSLTPGQKLQYNSPTHQIWVTGRVEGFDRNVQTVRVHWGGVSESLTLDKVRMPREDSDSKFEVPYWAVAAASALGGGVIGALLMRLLMR